MKTTLITLHCSAAILVSGCKLLQAAESPLPTSRSYDLQGELTYSYFRGATQTYKQKLRCELLRNNDHLRITTYPYASNYPATSYLCDGTNACTYVQYRADDPSQQASPTRAWNNASVFVSNERMPRYGMGHLSPLWLMAQGRAEHSKNTNDPWLTVFGDLTVRFQDKVVVVPDLGVRRSWADGFAHFRENIEYADFSDQTRTIHQEATFNILTWTNCVGTEFPASFEASVRKTLKTDDAQSSLIGEAKFTFLATKISLRPEMQLEFRAPPYSVVSDVRPFEAGKSAAGVSYHSTNGVIYADPTGESEKHGLHLTSVQVKPAKSDGPKVGVPAPDFSIKTLDDKVLKLADLRGKFVLLDFWATWCGPCVAEMPNLKETYDAFTNDARLVMVGLSLDKDRDQMTRFLKAKDIRWQQALLTDGWANTVARNYGVETVPSTFLIGPDGKLRACGLRGHVKETIASMLAHQ
jgi:peroxiredoxin